MGGRGFSRLWWEAGRAGAFWVLSGGGLERPPPPPPPPLPPPPPRLKGGGGGGAEVLFFMPPPEEWDEPEEELGGRERSGREGRWERWWSGGAGLCSIGGEGEEERPEGGRGALGREAGGRSAERPTVPSGGGRTRRTCIRTTIQKGTLRPRFS